MPRLQPARAKSMRAWGGDQVTVFFFLTPNVPLSVTSNVLEKVLLKHSWIYQYTVTLSKDPMLILIWEVCRKPQDAAFLADTRVMLNQLLLDSALSSKALGNKTLSGFLSWRDIYYIHGQWRQALRGLPAEWVWKITGDKLWWPRD